MLKYSHSLKAKLLISLYDYKRKPPDCHFILIEINSTLTLSYSEINEIENNWAVSP